MADRRLRARIKRHVRRFWSDLWTVVQTGINAVRPRPAIVDWSIFTVVAFEVVSGLVSFLGTTPAWAPLFWAHRIAGLSLIVLLGFKLARVRYRLTDRNQWQPTTLLSVVTLLVAVATLGTGIVWVFGYQPAIPLVSLLSVHVGLGLLAFVLVVLHMKTRFRLPRRADFDRRRTTLQYAGLFITGAIVYRGQELINTVFETNGTNRRLTGSQRERGSGNESFPPTSWVADDPDPIDTEDWQLTIQGKVDTRLELTADQLQPDQQEKALLDCTGGWYTIQNWGGVRVGDLLEETGVTADAQYVRFVSVTGYRWSLPIEEAREALLATHVGGESLSHGHGAPLRLVAPGRRGFQWVKWIERIDVRRRRDPEQWVVTLISGFS